MNMNMKIGWLYWLINFVVNCCSTFLIFLTIRSHHCHMTMTILISFISYFIFFFPSVMPLLMRFTTLDLTTFVISSLVVSSVTRFIASSLIYLFLVVALIVSSIIISISTSLPSAAIIFAVVICTVGII